MADLPPKVTFKTNIPVVMRFPFGDFQQIDNDYGTSFKYNVGIDGDRQTLFATEALHERLQAIGNLKGASITVTKIELDGGKKGWEIAGEGAPRGASDRGMPHSDNADEPPTPTEPPQEADSKPRPAPRTTGPTEQEIHQAAFRAMQTAVRCFVDNGFTIDLTDPHWAEQVRAWAASILIASVDNRTIVRHPEDPDPSTPNNDPDGDLPFNHAR